MIRTLGFNESVTRPNTFSSKLNECHYHFLITQNNPRKEYICCVRLVLQVGAEGFCIAAARDHG